jgi:hypothetical protein
VHPVSQQTPSTQFPEVHALADEQINPLAIFAVQLPPLQKSPAMQSASLAHVVRHAVVPHANGEQLVVAAAGHEPAPLQPAAAVAVPLEQEALRHDVELPGYAHAVRSEPLQLPPHADPSLAHAGRPPDGAPLTGEQVPVDPARLHASHCPEHALLQQTPSVQLPDVHWLEARHVAPFACFAAHDPALQKSPVTQSASDAHVVKQLVAPHTNGAHAVVVGVPHAPDPSHPAALVATPLVQEGALHVVLAPGYAHAVRPLPSQLPPHVVPLPAHAARVPTGAPVAAPHVPIDPATLHASHCPAHAPSQQTPSTQLPDEH